MDVDVLAVMDDSILAMQDEYYGSGQMPQARAAVAELMEANRWRDPLTETPEIGQAVLVAYKRGRHTVVGSATYWDYKKGVHDDDTGPQWTFDAHDFIESVVAWKPMATYPDAALARCTATRIQPTQGAGGAG